MSQHFSRTHTHVSNRAKSRQQLERKTVCKSVLSNPFRVPWPSTPINTQQAMLARFLSAMSPAAEYLRAKALLHRRQKNQAAAREGKRQFAQRRDRKGKATQAGGAITPSKAPIDKEASQDRSAYAVMEPNLADEPAVLSHLLVGINNVTRRLEAQVQSLRRKVTVTPSDAAEATSSLHAQPPLAAIFVCRADIDPPLLIAHLPHLVATLNSSLRPTPGSTNGSDGSSESPPVKLICLPQEAELALAEIFSLRRAAVLGLDTHAITHLGLADMIQDTPPVYAPWTIRDVPAVSGPIIPTHIKQIKTTAPKDVRAAKEERSKRRKQAKSAAKAEGSAMAQAPPEKTQKRKRHTSTDASQQRKKRRLSITAS